jgi:Flp pilus assembly pilin Flp
MKMFWRCLIRDQRGISSVEFALVATVFFMMIFGIVDFSRAMWEWNAAAKATQAGVRYAVVSDIVSIDYKEFSGLSIGLNSGEKVPVKDAGGNNVIAPIFCSDSDPGAGLAIGCGTSLGGLAAAKADAVAFLAIVVQMQKMDDRIEAHNVVIEYRHIGLGFAGNPVGPDVDPLVTVKLRDMEFDFITPGFTGIFTLNLPDFAASLTGEDHVTI